MKILKCHRDFAESLKANYPHTGHKIAERYLKVISNYQPPTPERFTRLNYLIRICQRMPQKYKGYSKAVIGGADNLYAFMKERGFID